MKTQKEIEQKLKELNKQILKLACELKEERNKLKILDEDYIRLKSKTSALILLLNEREVLLKEKELLLNAGKWKSNLMREEKELI